MGYLGGYLGATIIEVDGGGETEPTPVPVPEEPSSSDVLGEDLVALALDRLCEQFTERAA